MKLVVGLGNPGPKYGGTRHNIGFEVLNYLAAGPGVGPWKSRFQSLTAEATEGNESVLLVKPETFMNLSGRAVRAAVDFYKLTPADLLVVCDDLALPLGKLRIRAKGSHGGQNGLRNIQEMLGTPDYARLRIGIGSPNEYQDAADYVLGRFGASERSAAEAAVADAARAILVWVTQGIESCMNRFNGGPETEKPKKPRRAEKAGDPTDPPAKDKKQAASTAKPPVDRGSGITVETVSESGGNGSGMSGGMGCAKANENKNDSGQIGGSGTESGNKNGNEQQ